MVAMQEIIWKVRPDLIIETGIANGGSLIMNASILALLDICEAIELQGNGGRGKGGRGGMINPKKSKRKVIGVDIDIRSYNKKAIETYPMASRIHMIQDSSIDPLIIEEVKKLANDYKCIIVCLGSNHTHSHVLEELEAYAPLISAGSYCVVFGTVIENLPNKFFCYKPWSRGNSPKTAVNEYLKDHRNFKIDKDIKSKLLMTCTLDGYIKRIS